MYRLTQNYAGREWNGVLLNEDEAKIVEEMIKEYKNKNVNIFPLRRQMLERKQLKVVLRS